METKCSVGGVFGINEIVVIICGILGIIDQAATWGANDTGAGVSATTTMSFGVEDEPADIARERRHAYVIP